MKEAIRKILPEVRRPSRYLGNEKNAVKKDLSQVDLKVALCFPDTYEIGMSNIGLSILYHLLNDRPDIACERVYAPWVDMEQKLRETNLPLCSLESVLPLKEFDILGISIPYELTYTNILTILNLAGIPFYAKDRDESFPLILGGGTGGFNPEPVADFFDAIVVGDGEEVVVKVCEIAKRWRVQRSKLKVGWPPSGATDVSPNTDRTLANIEHSALSKHELLRRLSQIRGIYIPSFFEIEYKEDGTLREIKPLREGYTGVQKASVSDLNTSYYPDKPIVPHTRVIHDRIGVEVQRGCTRGCRFCQAGYIYRPERQRSPETVKKIVRNQLASTGQEEVSLISLSIGDYDCITPLLKDLMDEHEGKKVGISIPATRVEQLTPAMMMEIKRVRKTGFTIAPEAATERMRNVINKGNSEENLLTTAKAVFSNGWSLMKFYFMVGLPTETDEDVVAIGELGNKTLKIGLGHNRRAEINLGVSPFVPKPFTPYQWCSQIPLAECHRKLNLLRSSLKNRRLHLKPHRPETSYLEGIFSRGDRRLSALVVKAWEKGCRFDEWDEGLKYDLWKEAWTELGIDPTFYVERERSQDELLPWDHLFVEMKKDWLWEDYQASIRLAPAKPDARLKSGGESRFSTPIPPIGAPIPAELGQAMDLPVGFIDDCSTGKCTICGVCDYKEVRNRSYEQPQHDEAGKVMKRKTTTEVRLYNISKAVGVFPEGSEDLFEPPHQKSEDGRVSQEPQGNTPTAVSFKYHCTFSKTGPAIFLGHLEFVDAVRRAVSRANLPIRFSQGFHPHPRISFGNAMAVGKEMFDQVFTLELDEEMNVDSLKDALNREVPEGVFLTRVDMQEQKRNPACDKTKELWAAQDSNL